MRILFTVSAVLLASCATPTTVQRESDYELCRLSILRPPLQSNAAINEADRQIRARGLNCAAYAGTILQQQQQGLDQMQQGLRLMQQGSSIPTNPNQNRTNTLGVSCTKMGDRSRQVYTFNAIACPIGYAPSY
jgi:hypothetical protein